MSLISAFQKNCTVVPDWAWRRPLRCRGRTTPQKVWTGEIGTGLVLLVAILIAGCGQPAPKIPPAGTTHFPLRHNMRLLYRETDHGRAREYTMALRFVGGERTKVFRLLIDGADWGRSAYLQKDSVILFETSKPLTQLEDPRLVEAFRQVWLDESATPGDAWEDSDTGTRTVYTGREDAVVLAGSFPACYKTVTECLPILADTLKRRLSRGDLTQTEFTRQMESSQQTVVRWFAPGIGLIKEQIGSPEFTRELVYIKAPGDSG